MQISGIKPPVVRFKLSDMESGSVFQSSDWTGHFFMKIPSTQVSGIAKPVTAVQLSTGHLFFFDNDMEVFPVPTAILRFDGETH